MTWSLAEMRSQAGRTALVTGVTVGSLGHHTALELARRGARVILAGRNRAKIDETSAAITRLVPDAVLETLEVDLADLDSVRAAAEAAEAFGPLDLLVNNAGVMAPPYHRTRDGFELQMATNHFGPFLLTGLLLPRLVEAGTAERPSRVVTVSSLMHRIAPKAPVGDPRVQSGRYLRWPEYGESKLANLLFTFELERRLRERDLPVVALAAHPGISGTHLVANGHGGRTGAIMQAVTRAVSQSPADGALPTLMAATADLPGGTYCGPSGFREGRGAPTVVGCSSVAQSEEHQRALWEVSEAAVDLTWP